MSGVYSLPDDIPETGRAVELTGKSFRFTAQLCECDYDVRRDCPVFDWLLDIPGGPFQWLQTNGRQRVSWRYL